MKNRFLPIIFLSMLLCSCKVWGGENSVQIFPEEYLSDRQNVVFQCIVDIPEDVKQNGFNRNVVNGVYSVDVPKAVARFAGGKEIEETHIIPRTKEYQETDILKFTDKSQLVAGDTLSYFSSDWWKYGDIGVPTSGWNYEQQQLSFAEAKDSVQRVKQLLDELDVPSGEFQYSWVSLKKGQLEEMERIYIQNELLEQSEASAGWTEEDEIYMVYAYQQNQGVPVFHELMGLYQQFALDTIDNAPIVCILSSRGIEYLTVNKIYTMTEKEEKAILLPFDEIADTVDFKYNSILGDAVYTVEQAKLFFMVRWDENRKLISTPIWRFMIQDGSTEKSVTLVDAETGREIFLQ